MRTILAGGTGLIGSALAADLLKDGHEVVVLSRTTQKYSGKQPHGARLQPWDGKTAQGWGDLIDDNTAIINLAGANLGAGRWTKKRKKEIIDSRVDAGRAITAAVRQANQKPIAVLQSSAVGYYGSRGDEIITEITPSGSDFASQVTIHWEASTAELLTMGIRRAVFRTGVVTSTLGGAFPKMLMPFRLFVGGPIGNGKSWFPWIHLDDEVAGIRFLLENAAAQGVYNLCAPNPVQNRTLAKAIGKTINRPSIFPVPEFVLKILFGEMSSILLASQRMQPEKLIASGMKFKYPTIDLALADILK